MVEYYFIKVRGLHSAILLKKDPNISIFVKIFQNFKTGIFIKHLLMAASEFIDNSHIFYPLLPLHVYMETRRGSRVDQFRITWENPRD